MTENPSAFPILEGLEDMSRNWGGAPARQRAVISGGMTLRDYFAGQALAASLDMPHLNGWEVVHREDADFITLATAHAYRVADAMLKQRSDSNGSR